MAFELLGYGNTMFGFCSYGPYWRQVRKLAALELLSNHRLQTLSHVRESEIKAAIKDIHDRWVKDSRVLVDMKKWFGDLTLNLVLRMIVGKRDDVDEEEEEQCRRAIREFFRLTGTFVIADAIPWLRWFDFGGYERDMKTTAKELDRLAQRWLDKHKRKKSLVSDYEQDFMGVMLSVLDGAEEAYGNNSDRINKSTCLVLLCKLISVFLTYGLTCMF